MKDSKSIISHLVQQPSFKKCGQARHYEKLLALLPFSFTRGVKSLYTKDNILFFVLNHPNAKMEFNYKRNLIKSLLNELSLQDKQSPFHTIKELKCFVTNQPEQPNTTAQSNTFESYIFYAEKAEGSFENSAQDPKLHALFESIRQQIIHLKSC